MSITPKGISLTLKSIAGAVCLYFALSGNHPPALAQAVQLPGDSQVIPMPTQFAVSPYDPMFKADIDRLNDHLRATDARLEANKADEATLSNTVHEMEGKESVYFWIISSLLVGSIALPQLAAFRRKKDEA